MADSIVDSSNNPLKKQGNVTARQGGSQSWLSSNEAILLAIRDSVNQQGTILQQQGVALESLRANLQAFQQTMPDIYPTRREIEQLRTANKDWQQQVSQDIAELQRYRFEAMKDDAALDARLQAKIETAVNKWSDANIENIKSIGSTKNDFLSTLLGFAKDLLFILIGCGLSYVFTHIR